MVISPSRVQETGSGTQPGKSCTIPTPLGPRSDDMVEHLIKCPKPSLGPPEANAAVVGAADPAHDSLQHGPFLRYDVRKSSQRPSGVPEARHFSVHRIQ